MPGDYGKPRPVIVIQSDRIGRLDSVLVCPLTSDLSSPFDLRLQLEPTDINGLKKTSDVMTDKLSAVPRAKCHSVIGKLSQDEQDRLNGLLATVLGLTD